MREGINPLADRVAHLTATVRIPKQLRAAIEHEDLSRALKLANNWYREASGDKGAAAATYASLLLYRDLESEALGVVKNALTETDHLSLRILSADLALLDGDIEPIQTLIKGCDDTYDSGQLTFLAEVADDIGDATAALELRQLALARGGTVTAARNLYASLRETDPRAAAEALSVAGKLAPDDPELHSALAAAWFEAGQYGSAVTSMERALRLGVDFYREGFAYTQYLAAADDWKKALKQIRRLLDYDDEDVDWREFEATALFQLGDFEKARTKWNQLWQTDSLVEHAQMVALCARRLGDIAMELRILNDAAAVDPEAVRPDLVRTLIRAGQVDKAREAAADADPDAPEMQVVIALIDLDADFATDQFEPEDWLEVVEAAAAQGKWTLLSDLIQRASLGPFTVWADLLCAIRDQSADNNFRFTIDDRTIPVWDTAILEQLGWRVNDQDGYLDVLAEFESRMAFEP